MSPRIEVQGRLSGNARTEIKPNREVLDGASDSEIPKPMKSSECSEGM